MDGSTAVTHPDLLIGIGDGDDAGVLRLTDDIALVQTVDFFTPIVDDAATWGRIAAANALSDVYAMGATPLSALQLVGWPRDALPLDLLGDVIAGGAEIMAAAGCVIVGGHSVDDPEPKYGFAVTGVVHPSQVVTNSGGQPGDLLVLTKAIGSGIIATGIKRGSVDPDHMAAAVEVMTRLNAAAAAAMLRFGATAATDVTGFGLLGHLGEMITDRMGATLVADDVPLLRGARELAAAGVVPAGTRRNLDHAARFTDLSRVDAVTSLLLADAQTNGGLLIAIRPEAAEGLLRDLVGAGSSEAAVIGRLVDDHPGDIRVA